MSNRFFLDDRRIRLYTTSARNSKGLVDRRVYRAVMQDFRSFPLEELDYVDARVHIVFKYCHRVGDFDLFQKTKLVLSKFLKNELLQRWYYHYLARFMRFDVYMEEASLDLANEGATAFDRFNFVVALYLQARIDEMFEFIFSDFENNFHSQGELEKQKLASLAIGLGYRAKLEKHLGYSVDQILGARFVRSLDNLTPFYDLPTTVINLDRDQGRYGVMKKALANFKQVSRFPAVLDSSLPQLLLDESKFETGKLLRGEIGCVLSHFSVWEKFALSEGKAEDCLLVFEDDVIFSFGTGVGLDLALKEIEEKGAELLFLTQQNAAGIHFPNRTAHVESYSVEGLYAQQYGYYSRWDPGWGAGGYVITKRGAEKLLKYYPKVGFDTSLDWQMWCMCHQNIPENRTRPTKFCFEKLEKARQELGEDFYIKGYVLNPGIITQSPLGLISSAIES